MTATNLKTSKTAMQTCFSRAPLRGFLRNCNVQPNSEQSPQLIASPERHPEVVKIAITGSPQAVRATIHQLHRLGFAEVGLWSPLQPTGKLGEVVSLLVRKIWLR